MSKLYTVKEISDAIGISKKAVFLRITARGLKAHSVGKNNQFVYTENDLKEILSLKKQVKTPEIINQTFYIIESKINKKSAVYGTHRRNFNTLESL
jgi:hypothetical protein